MGKLSEALSVFESALDEVDRRGGEPTDFEDTMFHVALRFLDMNPRFLCLC